MGWQVSNKHTTCMQQPTEAEVRQDVSKPVPQGADREVQRPKRGRVQDGVPAGLLVQDVQLSSDHCGLFETGYLYSRFSAGLSPGARHATKFGLLDCYVDCLKMHNEYLQWVVDQFSGIS